MNAFYSTYKEADERGKFILEQENAKVVKEQTNNENTTASTIKSSHTGEASSERDSPPLPGIRSKYGPPHLRRFTMPLGEPGVEQKSQSSVGRWLRPALCL